MYIFVGLAGLVCLAGLGVLDVCLDFSTRFSRFRDKHGEHQAFWKAVRWIVYWPVLFF